MDNLKLLNTVISNIQDLKDELIDKTRFFVDDNFPSYHQFLVSLKEKCKSQPVTTPEKSTAGKSVLEKLFGKQASNLPSNVPPVCFDEKTFDFISSQIKDWNQKYYYKIELSRDSLVQDFSNRINDIEYNLNQILSILKREKRLEDIKKSKKEAEPLEVKTSDIPIDSSKSIDSEKTPIEPDLYLKNKINEMSNKSLEILKKINIKEAFKILIDHINKESNKIKLEKAFTKYITDNTIEDFYKCLEGKVNEFNENHYESILNSICINCLKISKLG